MAALYSTSSGTRWNQTSGSATAINISSSNIYTPTTCETTASSTLQDELQGYIGQPMNQYNIARIKSTVTGYVNTTGGGLEGGIIKLNPGGFTGSLTHIDTTTDDAGTGNSYWTGADENIEIYSDYASGNLEIRFSGAIAESVEETKARLKREEEEREVKRLWSRRYEIKSNLFIKTKSRADLIREIPENEQVAMETLREVITEAEFRKYLRYGFVSVKGQSGKTYQVFRNKSHTKVWLGGKVIEEICIQIANYNIPPTDNVLALKTMIEASEEDCRKLANVYNMRAA